VSNNSNTKNSRKDSLSVISSQNESSDQMIRRFIKKVKSSGLVDELLQRRAYEKPSIKKKRKAIKAKFSKMAEEKE